MSELRLVLRIDARTESVDLSFLSVENDVVALSLREVFRVKILS